jgi:hypothetical protein
MSKEGRHHYIPVFYLKQWTGGDGRLCEFSRPYDRVKPRRVHPKSTGYVDGLYSIPGLPPELTQIVETNFMKVTDNWAACALRILLSATSSHLTLDERSGWSRFITSLVLRNPESVDRHKAAGRAVVDRALKVSEDAKRRQPIDPPTSLEYTNQNDESRAGRASAILLQHVIDSPRVGSYLNGMRWVVLHIPNPKFLLLTSDRPVLMTNGLAYENSQILLPISPRHVFVATNNLQTENYIRDVMANGQLIQQINDRVARQSRKFVNGFSDAQLNFVSKRLGMKYTADPLENLPLDVPTL